MFISFTGQARKVVELAHQRATVFQHDYVGTEHLFLGLLRENTGPAYRLLQAFPIDLVELEKSILAGVSQGTPLADLGRLPLTPRLKRVFDFAYEEAKALGQGQVAPEHLLLGLLRDEDSNANAILIQAGVKLDALRKAVSQLAPGPDRDTMVQTEASRLDPSAEDLQRLFAISPVGGTDTAVTVRAPSKGDVKVHIQLPGFKQAPDSSGQWTLVRTGLDRIRSDVAKVAPALMIGYVFWIAFLSILIVNVAGILNVRPIAVLLSGFAGVPFLITAFGVVGAGLASVRGQWLCWQVPDSKSKVLIVCSVVCALIAVSSVLGFLLLLVFCSNPFFFGFTIGYSPFSIAAGIEAMLSHVFFILFLRRLARLFDNGRLLQSTTIYFTLFFTAAGVALWAAAFNLFREEPRIGAMVPEKVAESILTASGLTLLVLFCVLLVWYCGLLARTRDSLVVGTFPR